MKCYLRINGELQLTELTSDILEEHSITLGNGVRLGDWVTSNKLNQEFIDIWKKLGQKHLFTKWVTHERESPNFDGGTKLKYNKGDVIKEENVVVSDQQCDKGLHVLRFGHRPEWYGLCNSYHSLIPLTVEVCSDDILFGGLPTMDGKLRVRRLKVLD